MKHRDSYDRERHAKRMEIPQQAFEEDKRKAESVRAERAAKSRPTPKPTKTVKVKDAIQSFNEARQKESEPLSPQPSGSK
jgi:hypothetical protein